MMQAVTGWVTPVATAAAVMTASNLGPRMTGWGFVVFFVGSVCWCLVAFQTDQNNLLWTNGFLTPGQPCGGLALAGTPDALRARECERQRSESEVGDAGSSSPRRPNRGARPRKG